MLIRTKQNQEIGSLTKTRCHREIGEVELIIQSIGASSYSSKYRRISVYETLRICLKTGASHQCIGRWLKGVTDLRYARTSIEIIELYKVLCGLMVDIITETQTTLYHISSSTSSVYNIG